MEKTKIGENAGTIWHMLNQVKEISIFDLCHKISLTFEDTALAIGWLAREDKLFIYRKDNMIMISLEKKPIEFSFE